MTTSNTKIVVNQPINKMLKRTVKITGKYADISRSAQIIY